MKKLILTLAASVLCLGLFFTVKTQAAWLDIEFDSSDGSACENLYDDDIRSKEHFEGGTTITVTSEENIDSLYIEWDEEPSKWTLTSGGQSFECGTNGFLHEYVKTGGTSNSATITIPDGGATLVDIYAFSAGELPDWVQVWQPPYDRADILYFSTHSDDDVLFFGGLIPTYADSGKYRIQAAYIVDHARPSDPFGNEPYRVHELLNCIWTMGLDHYPQMGIFGDWYSESLEEAEEYQSLDEVTDFVTEVIRKFKPQVVISQDFEGEYGHGQHRLAAAAIAEAVEKTGDSSQYPDSASKYGTWDVPKTYYHLYEENEIVIDARVPLSGFGGKTALEVAKEGYLRHESQQWMDYYVSDGIDDDGYMAPYPCTHFGLYRTTVGLDTGNDIMENLVAYDVQDEQARQETSVEETGEQETTKAEKEKKKASPVLIIIIIVIVIIIVVLLILVIRVKKAQARKKALAAKRARQRRAEQYRRENPQNRTTRNNRK
ncbi:MAG: PIG-L family deacetylase [Lachnospiraceae bacterium]|nr:PIG-L family deacetylase [Lachnospiraceae bacterium]